MQTNHFYIVIIFFLSLTYSRTSLADHLTVLTEHLAPFQIVSGNKVTGLSTEIVEAVIQHANFDYSIEAHPWSLTFNRGTHEKNTCIYSLARIPARESEFQWIGHIAKSSISLHSLRNSPITLTSLNEAKKYKIAVIKDDVTHHFLLEKGFEENINFYVMNNYDALLKLLETPTRQIDLVIINDDLINNRLNYSAETSKYKKVLLLQELTLDFHFACSLNTEKSYVERLKKSMDTLDKQGHLTLIKERWSKELINIL